MEQPESLARAVVGLARRLLSIDDIVRDPSGHAPADLPEGVFLQANRPYTNTRLVRDLIAQLSGDIYWLDRHLELRALDIVGSSVVEGRHKSITLIREGKPEERLVRQASSLREELGAKQVEFDFLFVSARDSRIHDRWLLGSEGAWTLPPASALGRAGELKVSADPARAAVLVAELTAVASSVFG